MAPFAHGKTTCVAVPMLAWMLGHDQNLRIKVITNGAAGATQRVEMAKQIITSQVYRAIFPGVVQGSKWTSTELYLKRGGLSIDPSLHARGLSTISIGSRGDVLLFDDVVDNLNSLTPERRTSVRDMLEVGWLSRVQPNTKVLYLGTPWHLDDATHHLMQLPGWCSLIQRVNKTDDEHETEIIGAGMDYPWLTKESLHTALKET
jgi:hypothetical protein